MEDRRLRCSRRKFLASAAGALAFTGASAPHTPGAEGPLPPSRTRPPRLSVKGRQPLALLATVYRPLAHAHHVAARFLHGYCRGNELHVPPQYLHSLFVEQAPPNDLSRKVAREFGIQRACSITEALTHGGKLAVGGVLLIGEHGNYPRNDRGQVLYPRLEMLQQVADVFRKVGRGVPVYSAKHLSPTFAGARAMLALAQESKFPLLAGSHLPLVLCRPELDPARRAGAVEEALVAGYGPLEVNGFEALEALQAMLESRPGRETGVRAVTCLSGKDVWRAGDAGRWSWELLEAALSRSDTVAPGDVRDNTGSTSVLGQPALPATAFLIEYRDGTRGTVLLLNGHVHDFTFAVKYKGGSPPSSCQFVSPPPPGAQGFDALAGALESFFATGQAPYPVQRTLLTTGILQAVMESHHRRGMRVETPELDVCYTTDRTIEA
jgi:hypothetical protein